MLEVRWQSPPSKRGRTEAPTSIVALADQPIDELVSDPDPSHPLGEDEKEGRGSKVVKLSEHNSAAVAAAFPKSCLTMTGGSSTAFARHQTCLKPDVQGWTQFSKQLPCPN